MDHMLAGPRGGLNLDLTLYCHVLAGRLNLDLTSRTVKSGFNLPVG